MNGSSDQQRKLLLLGIGAVATTLSVFAGWFLLKSFKSDQNDKKDKNPVNAKNTSTQAAPIIHSEKETMKETKVATAINTKQNSAVLPGAPKRNRQDEETAPDTQTVMLSDQTVSAEVPNTGQTLLPQPVEETIVMATSSAPDYNAAVTNQEEIVDEDIMLSRVVQQCSKEPTVSKPELIILDSSDDDIVINGDDEPMQDDNIIIVTDLHKQMPKAESSSVSLVSMDDESTSPSKSYSEPPVNGYDAETDSDSSHHPLDDTVSIHSSDLSSIAEDATTTLSEPPYDVIVQSQAAPLCASVVNSTLEKLNLGETETLNEDGVNNGVFDPNGSQSVNDTNKVLEEYAASLNSSLRETESDDKSSKDVSACHSVTVTDSGISVATTSVSTCLSTSLPTVSLTEPPNSTTTVSSDLSDDKSTKSPNLPSQETKLSVLANEASEDKPDGRLVKDADVDSDQSSNTHSTESNSELNGHQRVRHVFLLPLDAIGPFIGRSGRHINALKKSTKTDIQVTKECHVAGYNYCVIEGERESVNKALRLISKEYPGVNVTHVEQVIPMPRGIPMGPNANARPPQQSLSLLLNMSVQARVCNIVSAGHMFVQLVAHPAFNAFQKLEQLINAEYGDGSRVPPVPDNVDRGVMCVAATGTGWARAHILSIESDRSQCEVKLLDHGGYCTLPLKALRQIRQDFIHHPFQAVEVYVDEITPLNQEYFTEEATRAAERLVSGKYVTCCATAVAENQVPYVRMSVLQPNGQCRSLSQMLIDQGVVAWYNPTPQPQSPQSPTNTPTVTVS